MKNFEKLLANPEGQSPTVVQKSAEIGFSTQLSLSKLRERNPSEPIPCGHYFVIGIATYARPELAMLDEIETRSQYWKDNSRIDVFSLLACKSKSDIQLYLPGINGNVHQSPVIGVWWDKQLENYASGLCKCTDLLKDYDVLAVKRSPSRFVRDPWFREIRAE